MIWGQMTLTSNGLSYMDFKLDIDVNKAMEGALKERWRIIWSNYSSNYPFSTTVGSWNAGVPSEFDFDAGMLKAKRVYKIVSFIQPPFMQWNETLSNDPANTFY